MQLNLPLQSRRKPGEKRGGAREGAGRPRKAGAGVPHRVRPALSRHHPVHVTLRLRKEAQGVRGSSVFRHVRRALAAAREQFGFRLVQYSVQGSHVHLIAEANDRTALTLGLQALSIRVALAINKARCRNGRVLADRYHARQLKTPLEVRRALLYVLNNERKHVAERGLTLAPWRFDRFSSAAEFDGWQASPLLELARQESESVRILPPSVTAPRSFLLRSAWRRHGSLGVDEVPGRVRRRAT